MIRFRAALPFFGVLALVGCGGDSIKNPTHLRVFNGFSSANSTNIRVYVGNHQVNSSGVGPSISYGNKLSYDSVPSGTDSIVVNPYTDRNTTYASLTNQTLFAGLYYTVVCYASTSTSSTDGSTTVTRNAVLLTDGVATTSGVSYVRIVNATNTTGTYYVNLTNTDSSGSSLPLIGLAQGNNSGYRGLATTSTTGSVTYNLDVFRSSDGSNPISGNIPITLSPNTPVTVVLFTDPNSGAVIARASGDAVQTTG